MSQHDSASHTLEGVAIIGMSGRFPGAASVAEFWQNQLKGVESISHFSVEELEVPAELAKQPNYVRARGVVRDVDLFDSEFFGMLPREAELTDPQHRLFLECSWEAIESAGYDPFSYPGSISVFAGMSMSTYFLSRICTIPGFIDKFTGDYQIGNYPQMIGNSIDFLSTRVAYKLNLRGPAFTMQAGCSTSLLAVCQACQALLTYQSDMAIAGGSSITLPQKRGYFYQDGGMGSADGHTRTFDADAKGTVFGDGVAVVLLKRLEDAVREGDQIYAVIRGFATNNDGSAKVAYTAPSVEGQSNVIAMAHQAADVDPATIGYVEAHGTGTPLGDPIELTALNKAFRAKTDAKQFCAIGTAKPNIGHLDVAAGVTGLIHAAHIVRYGKLPPTMHFKKPNPNFDMAGSPFFVNTELRDWNSNGAPRRAGVSAFGVGGTNAHVVLEEAPNVSSTPSPRSAELIVLSARSTSALDAATANLKDHLQANPQIDLADVAFTLQVGRRAFNHRRLFVARDVQDAIATLTSRDPNRVITRAVRQGTVGVAFLFPGQGSQHPKMGRELYETEPVFRQEMDRCAKLLQPELGLDLRTAIYSAGETIAEVRDKITQTLLAQPAIFTTEYALAKLWMSWGIQPRYMLGHSVGEFVAACLAGVFTLPDALRLIAARGQMMQSLPAGAMLSVRLTEEELGPYLTAELSLAAVNAPSLCVVAGPPDKIAALETELTRREVVHRRLHTSHAFHSSMMDPILEPFLAQVRKITLQAPKLPYLSSVTGNWITAQEATDPNYWACHFREPVRFSRGVAQLREKEDCVLLEMGPGNVLATLARQHTAKTPDQMVVSSLTDGSGQVSESATIQKALGSLWLAGVQPAWNKFHAGEKRLRLALPTYPFERKRFWLDAPKTRVSSAAESEVDAAPQVIANRASSFTRSPVASAEPNLQTQENRMTVPESNQRIPRRDKLCRMLAEIFQELSGVNVGQAESSTSFLDLGFDSLFLTQVTLLLQSKFNQKITFRQLLGDVNSLAALAEYLDAKLPVGMFDKPEPAPVSITAVPTTVFSPADNRQFVAPVSPAVSFAAGTPVAPGSALDQLLRDQMQAMNQLFAQQIVALQGTAAASSVPSTTAPATRVASPVAPTPVPGATKDAEVKELKGYNAFKPPQKSVSGEVTLRQEQYIRDLIERYTRRTPSSKAKTQQYRSVLADPRVVSGFRGQWKEMVYPLITDRSKGSHIWDIDGNQYVDILNGFGPIMLGHRPEFVEKAVAKQLQEGFEIGPQTLLAGEVAQLLCEMTGNQRATFCNTGSEAVIAAMRVARTVTGRNTVVIFAGDYHGMFDEVLMKGIKKDGEYAAVPSAPGIPKEKATNIVVLEYGTQDSLDWIRAHAHELAAVIVEPVQSRHPNLRPVEFLRETRKITEASDTCFVFDEVVTGFRVHPGGCQELFDIRADLATYGKVLGGGLPIGVLAGRAKYMDALDGGMWQYGDDSYPEVGVTFMAGTFVRHPLAMAACKSVLLYLKEQGPQCQERLNARTGAMVKRLNDLLEKNQVPTHIENFASIFYFSFPSAFRFSSLFYYSLREKGVHALESFPCFLTTEHTDADIEHIVRAFQETIAEMQAGGILPDPKGGTLQLESPRDEVLTPALIPASAASAPLTESQLEILLSAQLSSEANCSFNESFSLHLRGELHVGILQDCLNGLLARHDALRATFPEEGDRQLFALSMMLQFPLTDLSALPEAERSNRFLQWISADAKNSFDLAQGPLVRVHLFRFAMDHHVLVFTSHHIVCDGWSTNVLLDELSRSYNARIAGHTLEFEPRMLFSEYARQQEQHFQGEEGAENERFWTKQFDNLPPLLNLPIDRPRSAVKEYAGATYRKHLGAESYKRIKKAGALQKCTFFVTLLAGFHVLLSRLSGQDDIVVGVPAAGQSLIKDRTLVGHCVNFVPLRGDLSGSPTTASFMEQMRQKLFDAYDHQNYTYGRLVRNLAIPRDPSRLPLMEVQFNLEKIGAGLHFHGLNAKADPNPKSFVNFDLFLNAIEGEDGLTLDLDYNTQLLDESTVARWLDSYGALLLSFANNPSSTVAQLSILSETERTHILVDVNRTEADYPGNKTVHQLFEEQVARTPNKVAIEFAEQSLTYAQLNAKANQLAHHLNATGVQAGDLVGIYMERSIEMVVALLATWKAGAAYVPLDPTFPRERLAFVFEDTAVPILLTQTCLVADLPIFNTRVVCVDRDAVLIDCESAENLPLVQDTTTVAYVLYTSGSTGKPKGVEITQRSVVNLLYYVAKEPGFQSSDILVAVTTICFDISVIELYLPLLMGAKLVIASRVAVGDGHQLLDLLIQTQATFLSATPATLRLLLEAGWAQSSLRKVCSSGEPLSRELANRILETGVRLWNMYGPTETTVWSTGAEVTKGNGSITIGQPVANTQCYVLDSYQQPVPIGVVGELFIGGDGVARGYYKRHELTAERFLSNPFYSHAASRLYRTGDQVRRLSNGNLEFLGRQDGQIKIRGYRVELGEIETALVAHPSVKQAVAIVREDLPGDKRLVAYLAPKAEGILVASELRSFLLTKLPDYMIPVAFLMLPVIPLSPNGKVDRNALPAPDWAKQVRGTPFVEARNSDEQKMAGIWAEVLKIDKVGIRDNIFELGADSLHVFQIVARANKVGINVKPRQILQFRNIEAIFADIEMNHSSASHAPSLAPVSRSKYRLERSTK